MFNRNYYNIMVAKSSSTAGVITSHTQVEDGSLALISRDGDVREMYGMANNTYGTWGSNITLRGYSDLQTYTYSSSATQDGRLSIVLGTGVGVPTENDYTLFDPFSSFASQYSISVAPELVWDNSNHKWKWSVKFTGTPTINATFTEWSIFRNTAWYNLPGTPPRSNVGEYRIEDIMIFHENLATPFTCTANEAFKVTLDLEMDYPFL